MAFNLQAFTAELADERFHLVNEGNQFSVDISTLVNQAGAQWGSSRRFSETAGMPFRELLARMAQKHYSASYWEVQELEREYSHIRFLCQGAQIPSKDISTVDHSHYGPLGKYPYESNHSDIELTFMITDTMIERLFFEAWISLVEQPEHHVIGWKNDFMANLSIKVFSKRLSEGSYDSRIGANDRIISEVIVLDAWPVSLSSIDLSYDNEGVQTFSVTMTYDQYYFKGAMHDGSSRSRANSRAESQAAQAIDPMDGSRQPTDPMQGSVQPK
jgi:hypothetical protein